MTGKAASRLGYLRSGVFSLFVALGFAGYGIFRLDEKPVLGFVLLVVAGLNALVSVANFVLAIGVKAG
jgi:hypothetical protein